MNSVKMLRLNLIGKTIKEYSETARATIIDVYRKKRQNFVVADYGFLEVHIPYSSMRNHYLLNV